MIRIHRKYHPDFKNTFSKVIYIYILNQDLFSSCSLMSHWPKQVIWPSHWLRESRPHERWLLITIGVTIYHIYSWLQFVNMRHIETHRDTCTYGNMTECYQWLFSKFSKFPLMSIYFIVISKKYMLILKEWQWVWRY